MRMLAGEGIVGIWELQVAAANAHRRGQSAVAVMLTEIVDAAEQEWRLAARMRRRTGSRGRSAHHPPAPFPITPAMSL